MEQTRTKTLSTAAQTALALKLSPSLSREYLERPTAGYSGFYRLGLNDPGNFLVAKFGVVKFTTGDGVLLANSYEVEHGEKQNVFEFELNFSDLDSWGLEQNPAINYQLSNGGYFDIETVRTLLGDLSGLSRQVLNGGMINPVVSDIQESENLPNLIHLTAKEVKAVFLSVNAEFRLRRSKPDSRNEWSKNGPQNFANPNMQVFRSVVMEHLGKYYRYKPG